MRLQQSTTCECGRVLDHVGVQEWQPSPQPGTYTMCPRCLKIYVLDDDLMPANVKQRDIPAHVLEARDAFMQHAARRR